jgi:tetratricopeptide (TPR) repeat protein
VDLTTGRVFSAQTLQAAPVRDNRSDRGQPEYPSGVQLIDESLHVVAQQAVRMYVPWTETKGVYFYNDGDCKLKQAYELLKAGSFDAALEQSQANVAGCREQPKVKQSTLAHALYNAGVMQMMARNFDQAKKYLNEAAELKGGDIVTETIAECEKAEQLDRAMRQVEERTVAQEKARPAPLADPQPAPPAKPSLEDRLRSLNDFFKKGLITKEDFEKRKAELLKEI